MDDHGGMNTEAKTHMSFRLPVNLAEWIKRKAAAKGWTPSRFVWKLVEEAKEQRRCQN